MAELNTLPAHDQAGDALFSRTSGPARSVSVDVEAIARKNLSLILGKLASVGQVRTAEAIGVNESTVSRMKDGELERLARMLAFLGIQLNAADDKLYPPAQINALLTLLRGCVNAARNADDFFGL